jgi:hypothetical protein
MPGKERAEMANEPINFDARPEPEPVGRTLLFTLDGKDYTVPEKLRPSVGIKYLYALKIRGEAVATAELLFDVLGADAMKALSENEKMNAEDMDMVTGIVRDLAMGAFQGNGH